MATYSFEQFVKNAGGTRDDVKVLGNESSPEVKKTIVANKAEATQSKSPLFSDLGTLYGGGEQGIARKLAGDISSGASDIQKGMEQGGIAGTPNVLKGFAKSGLRTAGDVAGTIFAPVASGLNALTGGKMNEAFSQIQKNLEEGKGIVGEAIDYIADVPAFREFAMKHPNAGEDFNRLINLMFAGAEEGKIEPKTLFERSKVQINQVTDKLPSFKKASDYIQTKTKDLIKPTPEIQAKSINQLENDYYKWSGQTKAGVKISNRAEARTEALNRSGTTGRTPQRTLAEMGIVPETQGTKFATESQANAIREGTLPLNEALKLGAKEVDMATEPMLIEDLRKTAIDRVSSLKETETTKKNIQADINAEFDLLKEKYGEKMTTSQMQEAKSPYFNKPKYDSTKPFQSDVNYQVGKAFQKAIEKQATTAGFEDVAQLNREIGDRMEAARYLESLNGNTLKYGKLGKYVFMGIGATLGNTPFGKILGVLGGEAIGELLMKADVSNPVKRLILRSIEQQSPEAYQMLLNWLEEQKVLQNTRVRLPSASFIPLPAKTPTPSGIEITGAKKGLVGINPKTGQFKGTFTSESDTTKTP